MNLNREVFEAEMSWRRFQSLYRRLPADGAFGAFIRDERNRSFVDVSGERYTAGAMGTDRARR